MKYSPDVIWQVSHAYHPQVAVQLICWFPPGCGTVVVALFATDKARMGDVFYDGVAARADPMIDQWKRETSYEEKPGPRTPRRRPCSCAGTTT